METKEMNKETAIMMINYLNNRIEMNNKLNKMVRKFMKEREMGWGYKNSFNGYWDKPTTEMFETLKTFLNENGEFLTPHDRHEYLRDTSAIFGQVYSMAVNSYVLKDLHDCEKHLKELESASQNQVEENELFKVERNIEDNRLNLYFDGKPSEEVRNVLKHNGFRWSPHYVCWTRQLTKESEISLNKVKGALLCM